VTSTPPGTGGITVATEGDAGASAEAPKRRSAAQRDALPPSRLESLDAFRGLTIAAMLVVNNPGTWSAIHAPLRHAAWHGWTPTDLIFPYFLFIVGVAMSLSFAKRLARGDDRRDLLRHAVRRGVVLIALGLALHAFPWVTTDYGRLRLPGVLQRIGLAYVLAVPAALWLGTRGRAMVAAALLLGYWALLTLVPVPGGAAGVLEPGRDLGAWLDRAVFGTDHLWSQTRTWDPEGLLGTLPAVASILLGLLVGDWLRGRARTASTSARLAAAGALATAAGLLWGLVFPINKPLWTSSYALFAAGMAAMTLAACHFVIDVRGLRRWAVPFVAFGVNALAAFFLSGIAARVLNMVPAPDGTGALKPWLHRELFAGWLSPANASLAFALTFTAIWVAIMLALYRKGWSLRV